MDVLKAEFSNTILADQDPFLTTAQSEKLLALLPDPALNAALREKWAAAPNRSSAKKWADINLLAKTHCSNTQKLQQAKQDVVFEYLYPRLDVKVSTHMNHLLKSPFVVHPGTGRVCVPIDGRKVAEFDPFEVPTVGELLDEINEWDRNHTLEEVEKTLDWDKTRLKGFVEYFRHYVADENFERWMG